MLSKYSSLNDLAIAVEALLNQGKVNAALEKLSDFVSYVIAEPLCTSQVLSSELLDQLCLKIGEKVLEEATIQKLEPTADNDRCLYIVTKLQSSGGHTKVLEDFIRARPDSEHLVLSTETLGCTDRHYVQKYLVGELDVVFTPSPRGDFAGTVAWLQAQLLSFPSSKVYVLNHHQDSAAVAAIQPAMNLDVSFYHHTDHHLCLGVTLKHFKHIDFHPMGYQFCRDELKLDSQYIPLSVSDMGKRPRDQGFRADKKLTTCTVGRSNKIEQPYYVSYLDVVPELLSNSVETHIHIGRLSPWALFKIRRSLRRRKIDRRRFVYVPWVKSVWKTLHDYNVDLYITSFPYGGGLILLEAMGAGVPVALHQHIFSRVLSGIELSPKNAFVWRNSSDLMGFCAEVSAVELQAMSSTCRDTYEKYHTGENLRDLLDGDVVVTPEHDVRGSEFLIKRDEWALWMANQVTFSGLIKRRLYYWAKKILSRF